MENQIKNKRVLITGASNGLGRVCAEKFASLGAQLVIAGRNIDKLEKLKYSFSDPDKHSIFAGDLTAPKACQKLIARAKSFLGKIDVVLHIAGGGYGFRDPLLTWEQLETLYKVNVSIAAEINRLVLPSMVEQKKGFVVHVGSVASQEATASVGYNTVKASLAAYVRSLGREMAHTGVIITGILPGAFYAPGNSWRRLEENKPAVVKEFIKKNLPRKKIADASEVIPLVLFLVSDSASMMSGTCIPMDAGEGKAYAT